MTYDLSNLVHRYGERTVLQIGSLHIDPGEIFALVGPSGAGKSTLLRLLGLLEAPSQGHLTLQLNGQSFTYATASIAERRQVVMVFQRPVLMSLGVRANVAIGLRIRGERDYHERVEQALARVALSHLSDAKAHTLSGGEMQRVAVARALVLEPKVLLLDEPTANLDPYNVRIIEDLIREQHQTYGTTIILVTHNVFQARRLATRVALLLDGGLVEVGPTAQLFDSPRDPRTAQFMSGELVY
ncbi:MAG: phosphate ABC transporter ATP-binding protein [Chloroflexi bacterium]|mgnify:FL=1|nr:phosphate ABC transporter ATP-binding protein [Chloroflexota bacterium]